MDLTSAGEDQAHSLHERGRPQSSIASRLPAGVRRAMRVIASLPVSVLFLPRLLLAALVQRAKGDVLRHEGSLPRVIWGPTPIINIKYWSEALRSLGYESHTAVWGWFSINQRDDFDITLEDFVSSWSTRILDPIREHLLFLWALERADIFVFFFDGGFLSRTVLRRLECWLLHCAGKKVIVTPYGSDIAVVGHLGPFEETMVADYPWIRSRSATVARRVRYFCEEADLVIRNLQVGYLPRFDVVWPCQLAIDTDVWSCRDEDVKPPPVVTVVHASNHRTIKGTDQIIDVIGRLQSAGVPLTLSLLERQSNEEVRSAVMAGDVVVEQLIGGFGLFAIEAMSAGKPVLSNLGWLPPDLRSHPSLKECPIVDCNADTLRDVLKEVVENAHKRLMLGRASRDFALTFHSYRAVGNAWSVLLRNLWEGRQFEDQGGSLPWTLAATAPVSG